MNQHTTPGTIRHKAGGKPLRRRKRSNKPHGGQPGRRKQWAGTELPAYPDELAQKPRSREKPQPSLAELCEALAAPSPMDFATVWLKRLALRDVPRYKAIAAAWPTGGRSALYGLTYTSAKPCSKCGGTLRIALSGRCQPCYKTVRHGKPTVRSEQQLMQMAKQQQEKQSRLSLEGIGTDYLRPVQGEDWCARIGEATSGELEIMHPSRTSGTWISRNTSVSREAFYSLMRYPALAPLYQWATNNGPVPSGYACTNE